MLQQQFAEIIHLIKNSRSNAIKAVNTELINLYWNVRVPAPMAFLFVESGFIEAIKLLSFCCFLLILIVEF